MTPSGVELPREFLGVGGRGLAGVVDADVGCGFAFAGGALGEEGDQASCLVVIGAAASDDLVGQIARVDRIQESLCIRRIRVADYGYLAGLRGGQVEGAEETPEPAWDLLHAAGEVL